AVRVERGGLRILTFCSAWAIVRRSRGGLRLRRRAQKRRPHVDKVNHVDLSGDGVELAAKAELQGERLQRVHGGSGGLRGRSCPAGRWEPGLVDQLFEAQTEAALHSAQHEHVRCAANSESANGAMSAMCPINGLKQCSKGASFDHLVSAAEQC